MRLDNQVAASEFTWQAFPLTLPFLDEEADRCPLHVGGRVGRGFLGPEACSEVRHGLLGGVFRFLDRRVEEDQGF